MKSRELNSSLVIDACSPVFTKQTNYERPRLTSLNNILRNLIAKISGKLLTVTRANLEILYDGLIPPLVGYHGLQELMDSAYSNGMYTKESHNTSGLYSWEREAIRDYIAKGKRVMVLAAGRGREVIALLRDGIHVEAWECNASLRQLGNRLLEKEALPCTIQYMEPNKFPCGPKGKIYDFCILGWSAYAHILRKQDRVALLTQIRKVVRGPVLISFTSKTQVRNTKQFLRNLISFIPGTIKDMSYDLVANPGASWVGLDEENVTEEAEEAGFVTRLYKNHRPEDPHALLMPKSQLPTYNSWGFT